MTHYAIGVHIHGLGDPEDNTSGDPVVFCQGDLTGGLAAAIASYLSTYTLRHWIEVKPGQIGGFGWQSDPRHPIGEDSSIKVKIKDIRGQLGPLFYEDQLSSPSQQWPIRENYVESTQTTIVVYGDFTPGINRIYWINEEAVLLTASVPLGNGSFTLTISRAQCGSRARRHRLRPKTYVSGTGLNQHLYLRARPDFDRLKYPATIWQQRVEGNTAQSVVTWRKGWVLTRPKPTGDAYEVQIDGYTKILNNITIGDGVAGVSLSHAINVIKGLKAPNAIGQGGLSINNVFQNIGGDPISAVAGNHPRIAEYWLTLEEAERIFGVELHEGTDPSFDATLTADFIADILPGLGDVSGAAALRFLTESGGWCGTLRLTSVELTTGSYGPSGGSISSTTQYLRLRAELAEAYEGSIGDNGVIDQLEGDNLTGARPEGLVAGFTVAGASHEPIQPGTDGPKITLEWALKPVNFFTASLYWLTSDLARSSDNNGAYDVLPCWCIDQDPLNFDIGTPGGSVPAIDPATSEFLKLAQLQPQKWDYVFRMGDKLVDVLNNEALRAIVLWSSAPTTGLYGFRQMMRGVSGALAALKPEVGTPESVVLPSNRLPPVNQIRLELGSKGKDREASAVKTLVLQDGLGDGLSADQVYSQTIRFYKSGIFSEYDWSAIDIGRFSFWYFRMLRNAPSVYKVPLSIATEGAHRGADLVGWTDRNIQTASGRGVTNLGCMIIATDNDLGKGREYVVLLPYFLANRSNFAGDKGPALVLIGYEEISAPNQWRCYVRVLGQPNTTNLVTAFSGFYGAFDGGTNRMRLETPSGHNPAIPKERKGKLEASFFLDAVGSNNAGLNWIDITIISAWDRSGAIDIEADLLVVNRTRFLLSDWRKSNSNIEATNIYPSALQGPEEYGIAAYAPEGAEEPLNNIYYTYQ